MEIPVEGLRLNVGCGGKYIDGWVNVDVVEAPGLKSPDIVAPASKIPLPDNSVCELMAIHVWEHFFRWECDDVITEWRRLMKPGAALILEMPDLFKFCRNILEAKAGRKGPEQLGLWGLYGDPRDKNPYMNHKWGWTFSTLAPYLSAHGFISCTESSTEWHAVGRDVRDFRLTARKA